MWTLLQRTHLEGFLHSIAQLANGSSTLRQPKEKLIRKRGSQGFYRKRVHAGFSVYNLS